MASGPDIWDAMRSSAEAVSEPPTDRVIEIAAAQVRLQLFGGVADVLQAPFAHLEVRDPPDAVSATVVLWDSASSGAPTIELPPPIEAEQEGASSVWSSGHRHLRWWPHKRVLMAYDRGTRQGWWWVPDAAHTPWGEHVAPLRPILFWWGEDEGIHLLHAGAVATRAGDGVLLVGRGGSGKSTTAIACLQAGLDYVADDYVAWRPNDGCVVHGLYATAKLEPDAMARFPGLAPTDPASAVGPKVILDIQRTAPELMRRACTLRAVLLPTVSQHGPVLTEVSRAEALRALAPSTVLQRRSGTGAIVRDMAHLLAQVPCFRLELGPDPLAVPPVIKELLGHS